MTDLIIPSNRTPVQMSAKQKVCVLIHNETKRILCFCMDDQFSKSFEHSGYRKVEIKHANEYDLWAKRLREQSKVENEAEDYAYLERENATRQKLRQQLKDRLATLSDGPQRLAVDSALHCLDVMEARRQRKREETFMAQEGYEATTNVGEAIVDKAMKPKAKGN